MRNEAPSIAEWPKKILATKRKYFVSLIYWVDLGDIFFAIYIYIFENHLHEIERHQDNTGHTLWLDHDNKSQCSQYLYQDIELKEYWTDRDRQVIFYLFLNQKQNWFIPIK